MYAVYTHERKRALLCTVIKAVHVTHRYSKKIYWSKLLAATLLNGNHVN